MGVARAFLMCLALARAASGQAVDPAPMLTAARDTMAAARFCVLGTLDAEGHPQARLMEPFPPDDQFVVWLGTSPGTRKVAQIRRDGRATLTCVNATGPDYVTLVGRAAVVDDLQARRDHWRDGWDQFFPGGPEGSNYVAIRFDTARVEIVSTSHRIAHEPAGPAPAIVERRGGAWVVVATGTKGGR
jgi:general stress protein 26